MIPGVDLNLCRKPEILADAAWWILTSEALATTGQFFIDDDLLRQHGVTDLDPYAVVPGTKNFLIPTSSSTDTAAGFMLTFNLRIDGSSTSSINRGGFSLVLVGKDPTRSLELAFSANEVFAYDYVAGDPDRFVRGASAGLMANVPYSYVLTVANDAFNLNINGQNLLSGGLVDYTGQGLPYTTPNFVFFGDDTSRASANAYLGPLVLTSTVPEPARAWLWLPGLLLLAGWLGARRRRQ
jgi:hypothetical protein